MPAPLAPAPRNYLPANFTVTDWPSVAQYYQPLLDRPLNNLDTYHAWIANVDELHAALQEELGWRYITMTRNTQDATAVERYQYFIEQISPQAAPLDNQLAKRFYDSPYRQELKGDEYALLVRTVGKDLELFREENVALNSQAEVKAREYGSIAAAMTLNYKGNTLTLQQAAAYLEREDRTVRSQVWHLIAERRAQDEAKLDSLLDELLLLRQQLASNAGYTSYADYKLKELGRFDYGRQECFSFHQAIEQAITPFYAEIIENRRRRLGLSEVRPWDLAVDPFGHEPLKPFTDGEELADKTIQLYQRLAPPLGQMVSTLQQMGHLDLDSRVGKAPGGYNYPLYETGVPFIFMNAVGTQADLTTMVHECGHAIHSFVTRELPLTAFKELPSEVAELASMSSELITMDYWDTFYTSEAELRRAKMQQIVRTLTLLPWVACVDAFQFWMYDNPGHSITERRETWLALQRRFFGEVVNWQGLEQERAYQWQRQLHIYEVPFYYIEYGIAQLGALQVWQHYKQNPKQGLEDYLQGLKLGYTRPIPEIYKAAGISFDFSAAMLGSLLAFVRHELDALGFFSFVG